MSKKSMFGISVIIIAAIFSIGAYKTYQQHQHNKQIKAEEAQVNAMLDWGKRR